MNDKLPLLKTGQCYETFYTLQQILQIDWIYVSLHCMGIIITVHHAIEYRSLLFFKMICDSLIYFIYTHLLMYFIYTLHLYSALFSSPLSTQQTPEVV